MKGIKNLKIKKSLPSIILSGLTTMALISGCNGKIKTEKEESEPVSTTRVFNVGEHILLEHTGDKISAYSRKRIEPREGYEPISVSSYHINNGANPYQILWVNTEPVECELQEDTHDYTEFCTPIELETTMENSDIKVLTK